MKPENCAVFILAAGLSTRFGQPDKLMETLRGKPILSHAIETTKTVEFQSNYGIVPHTSQRRRALFEKNKFEVIENATPETCLLYTSPSPRDATLSRMPSSA